MLPVIVIRGQGPRTTIFRRFRRFLIFRRSEDDGIYKGKRPLVAPLGLAAGARLPGPMLQKLCCRGYAAGSMLQVLCCRGYAAGAMPQGLCCRGYAAGAMLQGLCRKGYAADAVLQGLCCRGRAALKVVGAQRGSVLNLSLTH